MVRFWYGIVLWHDVQKRKSYKKEKFKTLKNAACMGGMYCFEFDKQYVFTVTGKRGCTEIIHSL